jgi:uncharacterized membrane protein YdjX (TVP38/TMEM64 family)
VIKIDILSLFSNIGLEGVFFGSLISNAIPYSAMPYLALVAAYSAAFPNEKLIVAITGGVGATLGKLLLYGITRVAGKGLKNRKQNVQYLNLLLGAKSSFITIFLFAASPLPDDVVYIPLGLAGFSFLKFLIPLLIGKIFLVGLVAFLGSRARFLIESSIHSGLLPITILAMIIFTIELILVVFFVNWMYVFQVYNDKGFKAALKVFLKETYLVVTLNHPDLKKWFNERRIFKKL